MPKKRTTDIRTVSTVDGDGSPVVGHEGTLTLTPAEDDPVTLADLAELLGAAMTEQSIPGTATITQSVTINISY